MAEVASMVYVVIDCRVPMAPVGREMRYTQSIQDKSC